MPTGGHNRVPRQQKIIRGTFRRDRNPAEEIPAEPVGDVPRPPSHLNRWAKKLWKTIAAKLVEARVLTDIDLVTLELCCVQYGLYRDLYDQIHCRITDPATGRVRRRTAAEYLAGRNSQTQPEYTAMTKAFQQWKSYMAEFGLSPLARNRINHAPADREADPMEELLNAK